MTVARAEPTGRGRPRSAEADRAITEAVLDALADEGIAHFSVEAVALRAGVGKATIYRRFSGRDDLLAAALDRLGDDLPSLPDPSGDARSRLHAHLDQIRVPMADSRTGRIMSQLMSAGPRHPEFLAVFYERVISPRRRVLVETLESGIDEGWVSADADLEAAATLLVGAMLYVKMWRGAHDDFASTQAVIDTALAGIGVSGRRPASGS